MFTPRDLAQIKEMNLSLDEVEEQLKRFKQGFPYLTIISAATIDKGIMRIPETAEKHYIEEWAHFLRDDHQVVKFVPASGAASRMFKDLFAFLDADYAVPTTEAEKTFFGNIDKFAFYLSLDASCKDLYGHSVSELVERGRYKDVVSTLLMPDGLNYGYLPKGLLLFHKYPEGNRTPVGEHLTEGSYYAMNRDREVNIHFTVSPEHRPFFEALVGARKSAYEMKLDCFFDVSYSEQKPCTNTIAVDMNDEPFREEDGSLLFRPGGHGALIENLNDVDAEIIFIKNIDNVVPDRLKPHEAQYKKLLAGVLVRLRQRAFGYLEKLEKGNCSTEELAEMFEFTKNELCIIPPEGGLTESLPDYLKRKLDRPFRVCGMVKNVGEPGGGPFIVKNADGTASLQILESSQIDPNDPKAMEALKKSSHFNPVDLVCAVKDRKGKKYHLPDYVDKNTGFISKKSKNGKELKALELPGLWNGGMSDWNTIFVEVPISTFNPVKTVNDLLRPEHQ